MVFNQNLYSNATEHLIGARKKTLDVMSKTRIIYGILTFVFIFVLHFAKFIYLMDMFYFYFESFHCQS